MCRLKALSNPRPVDCSPITLVDCLADIGVMATGLARDEWQDRLAREVSAFNDGAHTAHVESCVPGDCEPWPSQPSTEAWSHQPHDWCHTALLSSHVRAQLQFRTCPSARRTVNRRACTLVDAQLLLCGAAGWQAGHRPASWADAPFASSAVYWVIGLSAAGKTTFAKFLCTALHRSGRRVVRLDGDTLRLMLVGDPSYAVAERRRLGFRYAELARLIASSGSDVVCASISPFSDVRRSIRKCMPRFTEVWIDAPAAVLRGRDRKGLYRNDPSGALGSVVGIDIPFELPDTVDARVMNDGTLADLRAAAWRLAGVSHPGS